MTTATSTATSKAHDHPPTDPAPPGGLTDAQIEVVAHAVHECMYAYGRARGHNNVSHFGESPDWQKEEARGFVRTVAGGKKLDSHGLTKLEQVKRKIAAAVIPPLIDAIAED